MNGEFKQQRNEGDGKTHILAPEIWRANWLGWEGGKHLFVYVISHHKLDVNNFENE